MEKIVLIFNPLFLYSLPSSILKKAEALSFFLTSFPQLWACTSSWQAGETRMSVRRISWQIREHVASGSFTSSSPLAIDLDLPLSVKVYLPYKFVLTPLLQGSFPRQPLVFRKVNPEEQTKPKTWARMKKVNCVFQQLIKKASHRDVERHMSKRECGGHKMLPQSGMGVNLWVTDRKQRSTNISSCRQKQWKQ